MAVEDITRIRLRIGDRGTTPQFSDAEIETVIEDAGSWQRACLHLVKSQMAELAGLPDFRSGSLEFEHEYQMDAFRVLLSNLRSEFKMWDDGVQAGSIQLQDVR